MLKPAILYSDDLNRKYASVSFNYRYKWYHMGYEHLSIDISDNTWSVIQFVSVDKENSVIGYLSAAVFRHSYSVDSITVISFDEITNNIFAMDLLSFFRFLKSKNFNKISWSVVIGNPVEKQYDRLASRIGARIVGVQKKHIFIENKLYDNKLYEWINCDTII